MLSLEAGGTAGCVLASRLSEDPANRVLLLESGKSDGRLLHARIPLLYPQLHTDLRYDWGFETVKQQHAYDRQLIWPRGKMLGGCITKQCAPVDYDSWGVEGWAFDDILPYFKKAEKYHPVDGMQYHEELHGTDGPWLTTSVKEQTALAPAFLEACEEEGIPRVHDINGHTACGSITFQTFSYQGRRSAVSGAYLSPSVITRSNLTIALGCHVIKICFTSDGNVAEAVQYQTKQGGPTFTVKATREVELCAGAIQSPHILMLSGVGPASHLQEHRISVIHNLNGVGGNLADHNRASIPSTLYHLYRGIVHRSGPLTVPIIEAAAYFRIPNGPDNSSSNTSPHFEVLEAPYLINQDHESLKNTHGATLLVVLLSPFSLGTIRLSTSNPWDKALVDPKVLADERDVELFLAALKKTRSIATHPRFARMLRREIQPGPEVQSEEQLIDYIRKEVVTTYHPTGTCKMGSTDDPMSVVDSNLIVHGTSNLRVVDCSIFPRIPGGQICWPTIAIAEKAADMIKKHKLTSWPRNHNRLAKL